MSPGLSEFGYLVHEGGVGRIIWTLDPLGVGWNECPLNKLVEFVEVDVTQDRTANAALGCAAQRCVVVPLFQVSCLQQFSDESQEASIVNMLRQDI